MVFSKLDSRAIRGIYKDLTLARDDDGVSIKIATTMDEVKYACELFNSSFDPFSGDFIPESEYETLRDNGDVVVATIGDLLSGALHQTIENNVAWISHVAVSEHARGGTWTIAGGFLQSRET